MDGKKIEAVTFDLWDTLIFDDSDEPKRAAQGLAPKPAARRELVHSFLNRHAPVSAETVNLAYDTADAALNRVWHDLHVTWTVRERLEIVLKGLGRELPEVELAELVREHEEMELAIRPDFFPGLREVLGPLRERYRLGVISDAIFSPGRVLRQLMADQGLLEFFEGFVFSDEAGCSKPSPRAFETAAKALNTTPGAIVHIGDREHNDIRGAHAAGARAILTTVVKDRGTDGTEADAVCDDYAKLASILESLDGG